MNFNNNNTQSPNLMIYCNYENTLTPSISHQYTDNTSIGGLAHLSTILWEDEIFITSEQQALYKDILLEDEEFKVSSLFLKLNPLSLQKLINQRSIVIFDKKKAHLQLKKLGLENPHFTTILKDVYVEFEGFESFKMKNNIWHFYSSMLYHFKYQLDERAITNASNNAVKRLYELDKQKLDILSPVIEEDDKKGDNVDCLNCGWEGLDSELILGSYCPECEQTELHIY